MSRIAVLGGGPGGAAAAVDLVKRGHSVRLWTRSETTLAPLREIGGVAYEGVFGEGVVEVELLSTNLEAALAGADVALACLPATALEALAAAWAEASASVPLVLNPGGTGGALLVAQALRELGVTGQAIAELSTLTYTARKYRPDRVTISGVAASARAAALPGGREALEHVSSLYPRSTLMDDVLATSLANLNLVVHCPVTVLGLAWVEATAGNFRFYADGMTPGVANVMASLDAERRETAAAFGHELPNIAGELALAGFLGVEEGEGDLLEALSTLGRDPAPTAALLAPDSLAHRYYVEDIGYALPALVAIAQIADVAVPTARALLTLATTAAPAVGAQVVSAARLGIAHDDRDGLLARVRAGARE